VTASRPSDVASVNDLALRILESPPGDLRTLLEEGCREVARALRLRAAAVFLVEGDGQRLRGAGGYGPPVEPAGLVLQIEKDRLVREAVRRKAAAYSPDVTLDPESAFHALPGMPPLAMLAVPLGSRGEARGVLFLADTAGRTFSEEETALALALARGLGIGIENALLYADARRRVEELSLLNEMGRTIASSLDLDHVVREAADAARRIVGAARGFVILYDPLRGELRYAGGAGVPQGELIDFRASVDEGTLSARVVHDRKPLVLLDAQAYPHLHPVYRQEFGGVSLVAVPVLLRGEPLGVLIVDETTRRRAFDAADVQRVEAVANQLAVAADNARLHAETRRRAEEVGLLHEVGRSLVATLDIAQLLDAGVRNLARIVDAPDAYLALATPDGRELEIAAVAGSHVEHAGARLPLDPAGGNLPSAVFFRREPIIIEDGLGDPRVNQDLRMRTGGRGYLCIPLVVRDHPIGAVVIVDPRGPRRFSPTEVERAAAIANQLAVAVENARLYEDLRRSYEELGRAQQRLVQRERLAALGEISAVVAHEVRNPLGVIFNSLGSLRRLLRPAGDAKLLLDIVGEEAERLNRIVGDLLDFARPSTPQLRPERLERLLEEAVAAALSPLPAGIELAWELDGSLPPVELDARLVRQAIVNVTVNAVQAMPRGGRVTVRARRDGESAVVEFEDSGEGVPDEVRERIFEPFFTTRATGTGLGLAVVRRIVDGHGGEITVTSPPGAGATFALRFPLARSAVEKRSTLG